MTGAQHQHVHTARVEFRRLDVDGNGVLQGAELVALADWLWARIAPTLPPVPALQRRLQRQRLHHDILEACGGELAFPEFRAVLSAAVSSLTALQRHHATGLQLRRDAQEEVTRRVAEAARCETEARRARQLAELLEWRAAEQVALRTRKEVRGVGARERAGDHPSPRAVRAASLSRASLVRRMSRG